MQIGSGKVHGLCGVPHGVRRSDPTVSTVGGRFAETPKPRRGATESPPCLSGLVPSLAGLLLQPGRHPPLKRWAIVFRPDGLGIIPVRARRENAGTSLTDGHIID
jgi:hypothetical protein